jgi:hypothetical protein
MNLRRQISLFIGALSGRKERFLANCVGCFSRLLTKKAVRGLRFNAKNCAAPNSLLTVLPLDWLPISYFQATRHAF